ncbi:coiled-coil domain-containing protein 22 [Paenibacillus oenotherae]|uniref:Coiled-coil domain-containing protein 22 n=1 Tax=Paenibacillus oenotherae TaxID=1435645 RepID=A0ABS7D029_9BACL|nr:coiled-coil domain-containing protein 22 [Paenibacillus oenotherae]MBW7473169.1 coiled-coil domain-containing protein 22 [Paenibacillus oenotherae]
MTTNSKETVHPFYQHAEQAFALLPDTETAIMKLKAAFEAADEDFLAIELKAMIKRLEEIRQLLSEGPQG